MNTIRRDQLPIALVGDDAEMLDALQEHLDEQHFLAERAASLEAGGRLVRKSEPRLLFVGFADVEASEDAVIALRERMRREVFDHHHAFVVCDTAHVEDAARSVMSGQFEDYVIGRPFIAPQRLCVMIRNALRRDHLQESLRRCRRQLQEVNRQGRQRAESCQVMRDRNERANAETRRHYEDLGDEVGRLLDRVIGEKGHGSAHGHRQGSGEADDPITRQADAMLEKLFAEFREQLVKNLESWSEQVREQHGQFTEMLRQMEDHEHQSGRVLVVDDNPLDAKAMQKWIREEGYSVDVAHDPYHALTQAREKPPALVVMDLVMPGMDGARATREIHKIPGLERVPVLMVSASKTKESVMKAVHARVSGYLFKPLSREGLVGKIRHFIGEPR